MPNQAAVDRPDLCARVFNMKRKGLMDELTKKHILGRAWTRSHGGVSKARAAASPRPVDCRSRTQADGP